VGRGARAESPRGLGRGATGAACWGHMGGSVFVAGIGSRRVSAAVHLRRDAGRAGQDRLDVRATWTWAPESGRRRHARRGDEPPGPAVSPSVYIWGGNVAYAAGVSTSRVTLHSVAFSN